MLTTGSGVDQDFDRAAELYRRACNRRYAEACYGLGVLYESGTGTWRQPARAASFFQRACDLGYDAGCESISGGENE
jgi:TPR repeat protein